MSHGFSMKGRKKGFKTDDEIRKFENTHNKIVKSLYSRGDIVEMNKIIEDTNLPRQTIWRHLKILENEGHIERHGKSGWEVTENVYSRIDITKLIQEFVRKESYIMNGNPEVSNVTSVELPSKFLSPEQVTKIRKIISEDYKSMPEKAMLIILINKRPIGKILPIKYIKGTKLSPEKRKEILEEKEIKAKQKSKEIQKLIRKIRRKC
jgi:DNA-binding transcriptional regulator YhcF (GntR family)